MPGEQQEVKQPAKTSGDSPSTFGANGQAGPEIETATSGEGPEAKSRPNYMLLGFGTVVLLLLVIGALLLITSGGAAETPPPATLSQEAEQGKALFLSNNCNNCHPSEGRAGGTGPRLSTTGKSDEEIINIIRRGRGSMPANSRLSNDEINKIIAYIRAIKPPPPTK